MELREPPRTTVPARTSGLVVGLLAANLAAVVAVGALVLMHRPGASAAAGGELDREVASKLKAAGVLDEAAELYERYLDSSGAQAETRAQIAYSLGTTYLQRGDYAKALRFLYEAESVGPGPLADEVSKKVVHCLERLGRVQAARAALDAGAALPGEETERAADDPVVARLGKDEIHRSEVEWAVEQMAPEMAHKLQEPAARAELLKRYVADELLWRKAVKLEYDRDPEVLRRHAALLKQLAVGRFVEREVVGKVQVNDADLRTYFEANKERYQQPAKDGKPARTLSLEEVRPAVERDYRMFKVQSEYASMVESELAGDDVELFPERMAHGS